MEWRRGERNNFLNTGIEILVTPFQSSRELK
jgi:hypothetical protein